MGFGGQSDTHDIAVILLDSSPDLTPAELPTAGLLDQLNASGELRDQTFTTVGYGAVRTDKTGGPNANEGRDGVRRYALQSFQSLRPNSLELSQNPSTGDGGICAGDSGGPHFLGGVDSNLVVSTTVRTDRWCRATNQTYRLDTPSARDFLEPSSSACLDRSLPKKCEGAERQWASTVSQAPATDRPGAATAIRMPATIIADASTANERMPYRNTNAR